MAHSVKHENEITLK